MPKAAAPPVPSVTLSGNPLPDERPITALLVVENIFKAPPGYWPVMKTHDEDSDADLWRQPTIFGKRSCRYLCISKSEGGAAGRMVAALKVVEAGQPPPAGFSALPLTADSGARAWRRRQLCYLLAPRVAPHSAPLTDIILCSRLKKCPPGFQYAGDINGVMVCYKVAGEMKSPERSPLQMTRVLPEIEYENIPEAKQKKKIPPERPAKTAALAAELNKLEVRERKKSPAPDKKDDRISTDSDYEFISPGYKLQLQPVRKAPPAPASLQAPPCAPRGHAPPRPPRCVPVPPLAPTASLIEDIPFKLHSKLGGFAADYSFQFPIITKKTQRQLDIEYPISKKLLPV